MEQSAEDRQNARSERDRDRDRAHDNEKEAAFEESRIGVVCTDVGGRIVDANAQFLRMLGYEWSTLRTMTFDEIVHPEDRWIDLKALSGHRASHGDRSTYDKRFLKHGGQSLLTAVRATAIGIGPRLAGYVVMVADVEVERETKVAVDERQLLLDQILASAPMILFAYDRAGTITVSEARSEHPEVAVDELLGRTIWEVVSDQPEATDHFRRGLAGEAGVVDLRLGESRFNCQYRPIRGKGDEIIGVSGVAVDVSALTAAASESEHLSEFLAMISHELRNPLNSILGFAELLASGDGGELNPRQRRYVDHIDSGGKALLSLVNDVLDLAKAKSGLMTLAADRLDVRTVLHAAAVEVAVLGEAKGVEIVERPCSVIRFTADARRVHQILINLLSNAVKFSPAGGAVEIEGRLEDGQVLIQISDAGPGISPADLELIFDEFRQAADHGRNHGTGLGLPISRRLAKLMGGNLVAISEPGVGSTFIVALPAVEYESAPEAPEAGN